MPITFSLLVVIDGGCSQSFFCLRFHDRLIFCFTRQRRLCGRARGHYGPAAVWWQLTPGISRSGSSTRSVDCVEQQPSADSSSLSFVAAAKRAFFASGSAGDGGRLGHETRGTVRSRFSGQRSLHRTWQLVLCDPRPCCGSSGSQSLPLVDSQSVASKSTCARINEHADRLKATSFTSSLIGFELCGEQVL